MDDTPITSIPFDSPQAFQPIYRSHSPDINLSQEIVYIIPQFDPECGLYVIFWDQILRCFEDAILYGKERRYCTFVKDPDHNNRYPLRLNTSIGAVIDIIIENPISIEADGLSSLYVKKIIPDTTLENLLLRAGPDSNMSYDELLERVDSTKGIGFTLMKAINGEPQAQFDLGTYFLFRSDYTKAMEWFLKAADQDHTQAQHSIGNIYFVGIGYQQNYNLAAKWFLKSAMKNYPLSMTATGFLYYKGFGYDRSSRISMKWLTKADKLGCVVAPTYMANLYVSGYRSRVQPNFMDLILKSAKGGHTLAQRNMGHFYERGERLGVSVSEVKAEEWYLLSAHQGFSEAQVGLARLYAKQDNPESLRWYKIAAGQGNRLAQFFLGQSFYLGTYTPIDYSMAIKWLRRSEGGGNIQAKYLLITIYESILGNSLWIAKDLLGSKRKDSYKRILHQEKKKKLMA